MAQLLWFQPLNWLVLRAWRNAAEEQCDRRAGRQTSPLALAQALVNLARLRLRSGPPSPALMVSEAAGTSHLTQRVQALIHPEENDMKRAHLILLALAPALCGLLTPPLALASGQEPPRIVVLDPAHGDNDPGAVGYANEARVVLQIALQVRTLLTAQGVKVILTRESSVRPSLQERVRLTPPGAAAYVSIHADSSTDPQVQGVHSFVARTGASKQTALRSRQLAEGLERAVTGSTGATNLGISSLDVYVLRKSVVPAVLIEVGYVSNPQEGAALEHRSYQARLAQGIARAILSLPR